MYVNIRVEKILRWRNGGKKSYGGFFGANHHKCPPRGSIRVHSHNMYLDIVCCSFIDYSSSTIDLTDHQPYPTTNIMSDQQEEQEMEAEALAAIFDTAFEIRSSEQPFSWGVKLVPVDCGGDADEEEAANHVMVKLVADIPLDYPEISLPILDLEIIKGLSQDNKNELLQIANDEAEANAGMPAIFAVCEAVRAWLADNNVKGLDDASMHAQMMRKAKEAERREVRSLGHRTVV